MATSRDDFTLPPAVRAELSTAVKKESAYLKLATTMTQTEDVVGQTFGGLEAATFVAELAAKPEGEMTVTEKRLRLEFIASPETVHSNQLLLPRNRNQLWEALINVHANSVAVGIDKAITGGTALDTIDTLATATAVELGDNPFTSFVAARAAIGTSGFRANGAALSPEGEGYALGAVNKDGFPMFAGGNLGSALGRVEVSDGITDSDGTVGVVGDYSKMVIGLHPDRLIVQKSTEVAEVNGQPYYLRKRNAFSIFLEMAVSVAILDVAAFRKLRPAAADEGDEGEEVGED